MKKLALALLVLSVLFLALSTPCFPPWSARTKGSEPASFAVFAQESNQTLTNQTANATNVYETSLDWPCFNPTKITFNFPYTNDHSITDIATIGSSVYKYTGGPTSLEFIASDVDIYSFTVTISYGNLTKVTIMAGLWSGTLAMDGFSLTATCTTFIIHVKLSTTTQPSYPSVSDVAQEVVHQLEQTVVQQQQENRALMADLERATTMNSIFATSATVIAIVSLLVIGFMFRRRREVGEPA